MTSIYAITRAALHFAGLPMGKCPDCGAPCTTVKCSACANN